MSPATFHIYGYFYFFIIYMDMIQLLMGVLIGTSNIQCYIFLKERKNAKVFIQSFFIFLFFILLFIIIIILNDYREEFFFILKDIWNS